MYLYTRTKSYDILLYTYAQINIAYKTEDIKIHGNIGSVKNKNKRLNRQTNDGQEDTIHMVDPVIQLAGSNED